MKNILKFLGKMALCAALVCPAAVSCEYDDTGLQEQIDAIVNQLFELEQKMNSEIQALKLMLDGTVQIKDVSTDATTGIRTITLSNGVVLTLYPKDDLETFVTYRESDGVKYWAYIDEDGNKQYFLDADNERIPVEEGMPEVITKDDEYYIVIGGKEYPLAGNSIFSDYEPVVDKLTGEVYAYTFTFGDAMTFTVSVDGTSCFTFVKNEGWSLNQIEDYYVAYGETNRVQVQARGLVDYIIQKPEGWKVEEYVDVYMGTMYFDITAPTEDAVNNKLAEAGGDLKVVAVLEGGKATIAKLELTANPFRTFEVVLGNLTIVKNNGLSKYVCGVCEESQYDEAALFAKANELLGVYTYPAGYEVSFDDKLDEPLTTLAQGDLTPGAKYVVWGLPAFYDETADDGEGAYFLKTGTFVKKIIGYSSANFEITEVSILDAKLNLDLKGVGSYYFGLVPEDEFSVDNVLLGLELGSVTARTEPMTHAGSVFTFAGVEATSATDYVAWLVAAETGKVYTESDVVVRKFSTLKLQPGSTVAVTADVKATAFDVTAKLTSSGADVIYYSFMTKANADTYADDQARADYLFDKGKFGPASGVDVKVSDFISKISPEETFVLFALATDPTGKYGAVLVKECATTALQYNSLKVNVTELLNTPEEYKLGIAVEGGEATEYLYWIGKASENTWTGQTYLGGTAESAQTYMYLNPTSSKLTSAMSKYPISEGVISMTDHTPGVKYVIAIMAKDADGLYSKATVLIFTPHARNLGTIVYKDNEKWAAAQPTIEWIEEEFVASSGWNMEAQYAFNMTVPTGFTAYVVCGTDGYITGAEDGDINDFTPEEKMLTVMDMADNKADTEHYDVFYHYEHGDPVGGLNTGCFVFWASEAFHKSMCDCGGNFDVEGTRYGEPGTIHHVIHVNDGKPIKVRMFGAVGDKEKVVDKVFVVCQDTNGNCYELFVKDVPFELFANAK